MLKKQKKLQHIPTLFWQMLKICRYFNVEKTLKVLPPFDISMDIQNGICKLLIFQKVFNKTYDVR